MSNHSAVTKPDIRAVRTARYCLVPPPSDHPVLESVYDTDIIPPDDRSLEEWVTEWQSEMRLLRNRMMDKIKHVADHGRQGKLGLTSEANERTPAQAVAFVTKRLIEEKRALDALGPHLASIIQMLQIADGSGEGAL